MSNAFKDVLTITETITTKVTESIEDFIFETLHPYCEDVVKTRVSKEDLKRALEQYYGRTPCAECIDKQAVLRLMTHEDKIGDIIYAVDVCRLPYVRPARPTGEWIEKAEEYYKAVNERGGGVNDDTPYFTDDIACPVCLSEFSTIDNETERFNFCPHCGADMRGAGK
jgi:hypothetical protein